MEDKALGIGIGKKTGYEVGVDHQRLVSVDEIRKRREKKAG